MYVQVAMENLCGVNAIEVVTHATLCNDWCETAIIRVMT